MLDRKWIFVAILMCASVQFEITQLGSALAANERYAPQLAEIMGAAQTRHVKLYLAGKAQNWDLADYELQILRTNLTDAAVFYVDIPADNVAKMVEPLKAIEDAIKAKDGHRFAKTIATLNDGCNACHQTMRRGFIVIRLPTGRPFGDESFQPESKK
jgi:hypothetical protein